VGLEATELGAHGALEVRVEFGSGPPLVTTEFIALDPRCVHEVTVDVSAAASANQIDRRVEQALDRAGVTERDIVTVRLEGRLVRGVRYGEPHASLHSRAFHIRTDASAVRPDYDLDSYRRHPAGTTEERFACALLDRLEAEQDAEERALIESALYYGLDAFRLRQVTPAYEELGG
jgi:hypothetical protein